MAQLDLAIVGGEVVNADGVAHADVGITDGRIAAVVAPGTPIDATRTIDAAGRHLLPGVIDPHVHMRFGQTVNAVKVGDWECASHHDLSTGSGPDVF